MTKSEINQNLRKETSGSKIGGIGTTEVNSPGSANVLPLLPLLLDGYY